jgi:hypothetical protein
MGTSRCTSFIRVCCRPAGDDNWTLFQDDPYLGDLFAPPTSQAGLINELLIYMVDAIMWDGKTPPSSSRLCRNPPPRPQEPHTALNVAFQMVTHREQGCCCTTVTCRYTLRARVS